MEIEIRCINNSAMPWRVVWFLGGRDFGALAEARTFAMGLKAGYEASISLLGSASVREIV